MADIESGEEDFETANADVFRLFKKAMRKRKKKDSTAVIDTNDGDAKMEVLLEPAAKRLKSQEIEAEEDFETANAYVFRLFKKAMRKIKKKESTPVGQESTPVGQESTPVGQESTPVGQESA